ncbi:MAG: hypothetical protein WAW75_05050 [Gallionella sp.]
MTTAKSLLHVSIPSNATAQQPPQKGATTDATATQQAQAKPASLLDIARNKLRNKHATTSENGTQQAQLRNLVLEVMELVGEPKEDRQYHLDLALSDPIAALECYRSLMKRITK